MRPSHSSRRNTTYEVVLSKTANLDIHEAYEHIRTFSASQADRWQAGAWRKIRSLSSMPNRQALIEEAEAIGLPLRSLHHYSHRIIYIVLEDTKTVFIVRIYHMARRPLRPSDVMPEL